MMTNPLFSIITVTLNNLTGLKNTYASLLPQTYDNFEWIVIDGASNDGTINFLQDKKAAFISEPDNGIYDAMNKGIEKAIGDYLIFMNAGDIFASTKTLDTIAQTIDDDHADFIYGDALELHRGKEIYKPSHSLSALHHGMITHHQSMIYRRNKIGNLRYDLNYKIAADYDFTLRFIKKIQKHRYISSPLCLFESGGVSEQNALKGRLEQFKIRRAHDISLWSCIKVFTLQTIVYYIRKMLPKLYWRLKNFATRL